jgi:cell division protein ZapB
MLEAELQQLEDRVQRLNTAYRQSRLELKRALQERDRLVALNSELRRRIEAIVDRIRSLDESEESDAPSADEQTTLLIEDGNTPDTKEP